jgi:hypothetical protein
MKELGDCGSDLQQNAGAWLRALALIRSGFVVFLVSIRRTICARHWLSCLPLLSVASIAFVSCLPAGILSLVLILSISFFALLIVAFLLHLTSF